jgi:hypothetical protein
MKKITIILVILIIGLTGCTPSKQQEELKEKIAEMGSVKESYTIRENAPIINRMGETVGRIMINSIVPELPSITQTEQNVVNITFTYENFFKEDGLLVDVQSLELTDKNGELLEQIAGVGTMQPMTIEPGTIFTAELLYVLPIEQKELLMRYYFDEMRSQASLIFYLEVDAESEIGDDEI